MIKKEEQIITRNYIYELLYLFIVIIVATVIFCLIGILGTFIFDNSTDFTIIFIIGGSIIGLCAIIEVVALPFCKTIIFNSTGISAYRFGKLKWTIKIEEINELIYNRVKWYGFLFPIANINMFALQFKLIDNKISRKHISISYIKVKEIKEKFNYPIRIIGSVYEQ